MKHVPIFRFLLMALLVLAVSTLQTSCSGTAGSKGDPGPAGATGPAGPAGAAGAAGATGAAGNANVTQITYAGRAVTGSFTLNLNNINTDVLEKSVVFVYIKSTSALWYQLPGFTANGTFEYRVFTSPGTPSTMTATRVTGGTGTDTFSAIRVLVIQASALVNGRQAAVDYNDYEAVKRFYNLAD